jgi:protein PhnA
VLGVSDAVVVKDCNGPHLADGDSVMVIKDHKVKGTSVTLKRGTVFRSDRLADSAGEVACNA